MANFNIHITTDCKLNPPQVPPVGGGPCQHGDTITFINDNASSVTLIFATASPFLEPPPYSVLGLSAQKYTIGVHPAPGTQQTFNCILSCNPALEWIIIVDGSGGPIPPPRAAKKAGKKKKKTSSGTRGKSKAKAKPKRGGGGATKRAKGKTKKTARRKKK